MDNTNGSSWTLRIERFIRDTLIRMHQQKVDSMPMLILYDAVSSNTQITARDFNGIVQSMKRAGIVGTARGGDIIFLSPIAQAKYVQPKLAAQSGSAS
jgi:hypothetical protein